MFTSLLALAFTPLALAAPTPNQQISKRFFYESTPWHLSDITVFTPPATANASATISFTFCDTNAGIELETSCSRSSPAGYNATVVDTDDYYFCANNTVAYRFDGADIAVQRTYIDPSVGSYPYWFVTGFGTGNTSFVTTTTDLGTLQAEENLDVPITAETA
ncbi:hypothetical protein MBLNU459_g4089t1 [Dothideomycetes sp. NU459]